MSKKLNLSKDRLIFLYIIQKKSCSKISKMLNCCSMTIYNYLKKYNIKTRNINESYTGNYKDKNASGYIDGRSLKIKLCKCGAILSSYQAKMCRECAGKIRGKKQLGKNNPNYIDGRDFYNYAPEFNQKLREIIKFRDNYKCQNCGMSDLEHLMIYDRSIEIHHIDYDRKNCKENNLITLCKQDNLRANFNRIYWIKFYKKIILDKRKNLLYNKENK